MSKSAGAQFKLQCHCAWKTPVGTTVLQVHTQASLLSY